MYWCANRWSFSHGFVGTPHSGNSRFKKPNNSSKVASRGYWDPFAWFGWGFQDLSSISVSSSTMKAVRSHLGMASSLSIPSPGPVHALFRDEHRHWRVGGGNLHAGVNKNMELSIKWGYPQNGWFVREHLIKMDDSGVPPLMEPPICIFGYCFNELSKMLQPKLQSNALGFLLWHGHFVAIPIFRHTRNQFGGHVSHCTPVKW